MDYEKQISEIENYFINNEKSIDDFRIGVEFENFVINLDTFETISYYGENGVEESLREFLDNGWTGTFEGQYLLGLDKGDTTISLEPGGQLEFSISPKICIKDIEDKYFAFVEEISTILHRKNQGLLALGYHPITKIDEIKLLPKKRYDYMFEYFKKQGSHAHNMMKGTAALQISIDFSSQDDYIKKFKLANALSPIFYTIFDNAYYFEGEKSPVQNLRSYIWTNCDKDRSGVVRSSFDEDFAYRKYAEYILNRPIVLMVDGDNAYYTGDKKYREIFDPEDYEIEKLEHALTMFFPDVRTKKFIEIRMIDTINYPLNFAAIALIKGLFYNDHALNKAYEMIKDIKIQDIDRIKEEALTKGLDTMYLDKNILETGKMLVKLAKDGLNPEEVKYLDSLESMLDDNLNPYRIIDNKSKENIKERLEHLIVKGR